MASTKGSSKRTDAVTNRARILQAALAVFAERGLDLEMHEVAARAHLGVGTLYGHFANREDLLRAILQSAVEDCLEQLRVVQTASIDDPRAALQAIISTGIHLHDQYGVLSGVLRDPRLVELMGPSYVSQVRMQSLELPKDLLTRWMQAGIIHRDLDLDMTIVIITSAFFSMDMLGTSRSRDELVERFSHTLLIMLTGKAEPEV